MLGFILSMILPFGDIGPDIAENETVYYEVFMENDGTCTTDYTEQTVSYNRCPCQRAGIGSYHKLPSSCWFIYQVIGEEACVEVEVTNVAKTNGTCDLTGDGDPTPCTYTITGVATATDCCGKTSGCRYSKKEANVEVACCTSDYYLAPQGNNPDAGFSIGNSKNFTIILTLECLEQQGGTSGDLQYAFKCHPPASIWDDYTWLTLVHINGATCGECQ